MSENMKNPKHKQYPKWLPECKIQTVKSLCIPYHISEIKPKGSKKNTDTAENVCSPQGFSAIIEVKAF